MGVLWTVSNNNISLHRLKKAYVVNVSFIGNPTLDLPACSIVKEMAWSLRNKKKEETSKGESILADFELLTLSYCSKISAFLQPGSAECCR
jgi:hypothetical protein